MSVWKSDETLCLRSNIKHSTQCFISRWNTSKIEKKPPLPVVFSALFSVFHLVMKHCVSCLIYYVQHLKTFPSEGFDTQEDLASFREEEVFRPWSLNPNSPQQGGRKKITLYGPVAYTMRWGGGGGGGALPRRDTFFRLQVYERVGKCVISICKKTKRANRCI